MGGVIIGVTSVSELKEPVLKDYEKEFLRDIGYRVRYKRGEKLFGDGDIAGKVYLVEKGLVGTATRNSTGDKISVEGIRAPGELLGLSDTFLRNVRSYIAVALCNTTLLSVEKEVLQELMNSNPFLLKKIVSIMEYRGVKNRG